MTKEEKINIYIVTTVTAKVANQKTGQSKDDCTSTARSATALIINSERAKQHGTLHYIHR